MVDYIADYLENIRDRRVFPEVFSTLTLIWVMIVVFITLCDQNVTIMLIVFITLYYRNVAIMIVVFITS